MGKKVKPLGKYLEKSLKQYFKDMDGEQPTDLHRNVIEEVEKHLVDFVLAYTDGNRSKASSILGVSRTTLRKKLDRHRHQQ